jgi:hypothetical protein
MASVDSSSGFRALGMLGNQQILTVKMERRLAPSPNLRLLQSGVQFSLGRVDQPQVHDWRRTCNIMGMARLAL